MLSREAGIFCIFTYCRRTDRSAAADRCQELFQRVMRLYTIRGDGIDGIHVQRKAGQNRQAGAQRSPEADGLSAESAFIFNRRKWNVKKVSISIRRVVKHLRFFNSFHPSVSRAG